MRFMSLGWVAVYSLALSTGSFVVVAADADKSGAGAKGIQTESGFQEAQKLLKDGNTALALKKVQGLLKQEPNRVELLLLAGDCYGLLKLQPEALEAYRAAVKVDPAHGDSWYKYGVTLCLAGQMNEAITAYQTCAKLSPKNFRVLVNLAGILSSSKTAEDLKEAQVLLKRAQAIEGADAVATINLGVLLIQLGRDEDGLVELKKARGMEPENASILANIVHCQLRLKDLPGALASLKALRDIDSKRAEEIERDYPGLFSSKSS